MPFEIAKDKKNKGGGFHSDWMQAFWNNPKSIDERDPLSPSIQ